MASNGRAGRAGSPSFLQIGLVVVIIVLLYSYWSVSSRNSKLLRDQAFLQERMRSLAGKKISIEKKSSSFLAQLTQMARVKQDLESKVNTAHDQSIAINKKVKGMEDEVRQEKSKLLSLKKEEGKYRGEVTHLRKSITGTAAQLEEMGVKAKQLMEKYKKLKAKYDTLLKTSHLVTKERDACKQKLSLIAEQSKKDDSAKEAGSQDPKKPKHDNPLKPDNTVSSIIKFEGHKIQPLRPVNTVSSETVKFGGHQVQPSTLNNRQTVAKPTMENQDDEKRSTEDEDEEKKPTTTEEEQHSHKTLHPSKTTNRNNATQAKDNVGKPIEGVTPQNQTQPSVTATTGNKITTPTSKATSVENDATDINEVERHVDDPDEPGVADGGGGDFDSNDNNKESNKRRFMQDRSLTRSSRGQHRIRQLGA